MATDSDDAVRVWLVERTYSDDEQNIVILIYATPDPDDVVHSKHGCGPEQHVRYAAPRVKKGTF